MTLSKARLVSKAELLRRLNRSRTRLYEDFGPEGRMAHTVAADNRIDLNHIDVVNYCHEFGYQEPNVKQQVSDALAAERKKASAPKGPDVRNTDVAADVMRGVVTPDQSADAASDEWGDPDEIETAEFMNMPLRELVHRFGTQSRFLDYVRARKVLAEIQAKDEDAARRRGEHVPITIVLKLEGHIDALQTALLAETAVAIRSKVAAMVKAGSDEKQIEKTVHDLISRTIKTTKATTARLIRDV
ncbi:hypothetical protein NVP1009O_01 [Vibrio phage 1.009.O._10N.261.51.C9]|nr:hypothetical protein NVP1009O_01 [Vibrio phage 1.009.O._10N.261.51.C9]